MYFTPEILAVLFVSAIDFFLGAIILLQNPRHPIYIAYGFFTTTVAVWGTGVGLYLATGDHASADFLARFLYFVGGSIPSTFLYFSMTFSSETLLSWRRMSLIFLPSTLFFILYFFSDAIISGSSFETPDKKSFLYGPFHLFFDIHLWGYFALAFIVLQKHYRAISQRTDRLHTLFVILGTYVVLGVAGVTNVIIPLFFIFDFIWIGPIATILWVGIIAYAVLRYQLFNIRAVAAELFVVSLWLLLLVRTIISDGLRDAWVNIVTLIATILLGFFLIRAVLKQVKGRQEIERLARSLAGANERLKELDQRKSEFVSLASHQLRSPLAAIKGYASMLLEGSFGALDGNLRMPTERILESSNRLVAVVEDFLTISRIEQNRLAYSFQSVDFTRLIETIVGEMKPVAEKKGLTMSFTAPEGASCMVTADSGKITQAVTNLVDNAIKYTPQGEITITSKKNGTHSCLLSVRDTGVGMSDDAQKNVFSKFVRGENAKKENVTGAGLGLYIAKQLVEAHRGKIWGESKGEGKGSTFYLELPAEN